MAFWNATGGMGESKMWRIVLRLTIVLIAAFILTMALDYVSIPKGVKVGLIASSVLVLTLFLQSKI